ncbi:hypothetical protein P5W99_38135 [Paraburkholderia sp. A3BS-1L]|uniref:hypothetical protein n=1 Tax=Paraburkholderia sp. A3BS-1L TaxID=3028375 RepID=UPI003DAA3BB6
MTIFIGDSESLRMCHHDQLRLHGLISIALKRTSHKNGRGSARCQQDARTSIRQLPLTDVVDRDTPGSTPVSITAPEGGTIYHTVPLSDQFTALIAAIDAANAVAGCPKLKLTERLNRAKGDAKDLQAQLTIRWLVSSLCCVRC